MKTLLLILSVFSSFWGMTQVDTLVRYAPGFRFNDGIYLSQSDFMDNCPSIPRSQLFDRFGSQVDEVTLEYPIFRAIGDSLYLIDSDIVWGVCNKGQVFLRHQDYYNRLVVIGNICHIIHTDEFVDYDYQYTTYYYNNSMPVRREANVQYIINLVTGEKQPFALDTFTHMLSDDPELYNEFVNIKSKTKRRERMFLYLRKYNDTHPLYFPINGCDKLSSYGEITE